MNELLERDVYTALKKAPTLRRNSSRPWCFSPSPIKSRIIISANVVNRMVESGALEWVNECHSAVRLRRAAE